MPVNILKSVAEDAAKEVVKYRQKMMQQVTPNLDKIKDIEYPEMKKVFQDACDENTKQLETRLSEELKPGAQHLTEMTNDINTLGTDLGLLQESTLKFAKRTVLIVPSIISIGPLGPSIAAQQAPVLIEELTQEAEEMTALSTRIKNLISKLQLDKVSEASLDRSGVLSSVLSTSNSVTSAADSLVKETLDNLSSIEIPDIGQDPPEAENCENYTPIVPSSLPSARNCSLYQAMDINSDRECSNCARYMPMNVSVKVKGWIRMESRSMRFTTREELEVNSNPILITSKGSITTNSTDNTIVNSEKSIILNSSENVDINSNKTNINSTSGISLVTEEDIFMSSKNNNVESSQNANMVYKEGMNIVVESGNASITTKLGTFKLDTKLDATIETEGNLNINTKGNLISKTEGSSTMNTSNDLLIDTSGSTTVVSRSGSVFDTTGITLIKSSNDTSIISGNDTSISSDGNLISNAKSNSILNSGGNLEVNTSGDNIVLSNNDTNIKSKDGLVTISAEKITDDKVGAGDIIINSGNDLNATSENDTMILAKNDLRLISLKETSMESRGIVTFDAYELMFKGVRPIANISGSLNCVTTCPFTGVTHWANLSKKIER